MANGVREVRDQHGRFGEFVFPYFPTEDTQDLGVELCAGFGVGVEGLECAGD